MDAYQASDLITQIIRDVPDKHFMIVQTDQGEDVFVTQKLIRKSFRKEADSNIVGKHVIVRDEQSGKHPVAVKIKNKPIFSIEFTDEEVKPLLTKLTAGAPLSEDEAYFVEAIFRASNEGIIIQQDQVAALRNRILAIRYQRSLVQKQAS